MQREMGLASDDPPSSADSSASLPSLHIGCRKKFAPLIYKLLEEASVLEEKKLYLRLVKKNLPGTAHLTQREKKKILILQAGDMTHTQIKRCRIYTASYTKVFRIYAFLKRF